MALKNLPYRCLSVKSVASVLPTVTLLRHATLERCRMNSHAGAWELGGHLFVSICQIRGIGVADSDAPASRNAGALPDEFPRWSVGTRRTLIRVYLSNPWYRCSIF